VVVEFDPTSYSVNEGQSAIITVVSNVVSTRDVTVTVEAVNGTARCKASTSMIDDATIKNYFFSLL